MTRSPLFTMTRSPISAALAALLLIPALSTPAAAMYHPTLGRWLQRDPIGYGDGLSQYAYVGGAPHGTTDPSGLRTEWQGRWVYDQSEPCYCGPDVTAAIAKNLAAMMKDVSSRPPGEPETESIIARVQRTAAAARENGRALIAAASRIKECPKVGGCAESLTICDKCMAVPHLLHILSIVYIGAEANPSIARAAGRVREVRGGTPWVFVEALRGYLDVGERTSPPEDSQRWSHSDLAANELGICLLKTLLARRWTNRDFELGTLEFCDCVDQADWSKIHQKPAGSHYPICRPCPLQVHAVYVGIGSQRRGGVRNER